MKDTSIDNYFERVTTISKESTPQAIGGGSALGLARDRDIVCSAWEHAAGYNPAESSSVGSGTFRKHYGKKIKQYLYLPLLDDRNINDQGIDATGATISNGNLYGSSKDIGTIVGKIPTLTEHGGRVNRVGFKRIEVEGTMAKFGLTEAA